MSASVITVAGVADSHHTQKILLAALAGIHEINGLHGYEHLRLKNSGPHTERFLEDLFMITKRFFKVVAVSQDDRPYIVYMTRDAYYPVGSELK